MEKLVAVCAIVLLATFGYVLYTDNHHTYSNDYEESDSGDISQVLCYSDSGDEYVASMLERDRIGKSLANLTIKDVNNKAVNLGTGKKKLIIHLYNQPVEMPILTEWAKTYSDKLQIIASFPFSEPSRQEIREMTNAGIIVLVGEDKLTEEAGFFMCFLDEKGQIVSNFHFDISNWKKVSQQIADFVSTPNFRQEVKLARFSFGETFTLPTFTDVQGKKFNLEDFKGKPTLLFLTNPYDDENNDPLYLFIAKYKERYGDKLNIVLVMDYHINADSVVALKEYYNKYKLSTEDLMDASTPGELLEGKGLDGIDVYFDQDGQISDLCYTYTGLIILDKDQNLVNVMELYGDYVEEDEGVEPLVEKELKNIL